MHFVKWQFNAVQKKHVMCAEALNQLHLFGKWYIIISYRFTRCCTSKDLDPVIAAFNGEGRIHVTVDHRSEPPSAILEDASGSEEWAEFWSLQRPSHMRQREGNSGHNLEATIDHLTGGIGKERVTRVWEPPSTISHEASGGEVSRVWEPPSTISLEACIGKGEVSRVWALSQRTVYFHLERIFNSLV